MRNFVTDRGPSLALVVLVMLVVVLSQGAIAYTFSFGQLQGRLPIDAPGLANYVGGARLGLMALMALLWGLGRRRALFNLVIVVNGIATLSLLVHTASLTAVLAGLSPRAVGSLLVDVVLMALSNILTFSIWYWIIDPPGVEGGQREDEPWAFLFPQRGSTLPHYEAWVPRYVDYLFVAFTTSFAFSPTDTLPLTRSAKMLMLLQSAISVITLTGIAGSAINILASGGG